MRTVTATAIVHPDHTLTVPVPPDVPPGVHEVVVVIQEEARRPQPDRLFDDWPPHEVGRVDPTMTFRREDIYGDDGR
jgi:hypothetical protein